MRYCCLFLLLLSLSACKTDRGYVIPWAEPEYSYKNYEGSVDIDSRAFYLHSVLENLGRCREYYTQYRDLPAEELSNLAISGDRDADFELHLRMLPNSYISGENKLYTLVHKAAADYFKYDKRTEALKTLDRYSSKSPFALYMKAVVLRESGADYTDEAEKLKQAGGYYAGMAFAIQAELEKGGTPDTETFCEAYFNGCDLYELKQKYKISCAE